MNLTELQREAHAIARAKGWYDEERTFGDFIALVHSELSEALEAYRDRGLESRTEWTFSDGGAFETTDPDSYHALRAPEDGGIGKPEGVASELADVVIRVADTAEYNRWDLSDWETTEVKHNLREPGFGDWIAVGHACLSSTWATWLTELTGPGITYGLKCLLKVVHRMAAHYGIDLDAAIAAKMAYMRR